MTLNIYSIESSAKFQVISTLLKLLPLMLMIALGVIGFNSENLPELNPTNANPFVLLATVTTLVMWSFVGIETATVPAENFVNPEKMPDVKMNLNNLGKTGHVKGGAIK